VSALWLKIFLRFLFGIFLAGILSFAMGIWLEIPLKILFPCFCYNENLNSLIKEGKMRLQKAGVMIGILLFVGFFNTEVATAAKNNDEQGLSSITITGTIADIKRIKSYIEEDSYLQMVEMPSSGNFSMIVSSKKTLIYKSDLPRIKIPSSGVFLYQMENIPSVGTYLMAVQLLNSKFDQMSRLLCDSHNKAATIKFTINDKLPLKIDIGKLYICK